jgi:protein KTI12
MPSLILTGYPAAGKTTVSKVLRDRALLQPSIDDVVVINEESACPDWTKQQCYETSLTEKKTRAALKSAFDRAVATSNKKTLVILDSLNYIKGFRYELHCISKAAGERHGILWILNQASVVEEWNDQRPQKVRDREAFSKDQLRELILRYEPPDERNRWDKPMFSVDVAPLGNVDCKSEAVKRSVYNMHSLEESLTVDGDAPAAPKEECGTTSTTKKPTKSAFSRAKRQSTTQASSTASPTAEASPASSSSETIAPQTENSPAVSSIARAVAPIKSLEVQLDDILQAFLSTKELKQGVSTQQHVAASANVLSEIDAITTRLMSAITTALAVQSVGLLQVPFGTSTYTMSCPRTAALPELRRLRRQYLQWVSTHPPDDTSETRIVQSFLLYLEDQLKQ